MSGAILHSDFSAPDWNEIRMYDPPRAAARLASILSDLEASEKQVFAIRGMCALLAEERELWKEFIDPEVDKPFASFDRWIKWVCPASWGYVRDALRAVKELRDVPFVDLLDMPRTNIETLKKVSTAVRKEPKVIEAAKTQTEAQFAQTLSRDHGQHIETKKTLKVTYDAGEYAEVERFLKWVGAHLPEPTEDLGQSLLAWAIDWNIDHADEPTA
jgi:hypothetical protein